MHVIALPELDAFRAEARDWLARNVPRSPRPPEGEAMREFDLAWQRTQFKAGWAGIAWPKAYGGRGASLLEQLIWYEEYARAGGPPLGSLFVALSHAGPTLIIKGSEEQKAEHLPKILRGDVLWCQGFSEPGAGSDLASLRTHAELDGDHLVVNGSKIWTSYGHLARYQELLARTDREAPARHGISWVICDMKTPGVSVRPIKAMSGLTHFCQVFYDNVRIPLANVVGGLNNGWQVAMTTLGFERGAGTISHQIELARALDALIDAASRPASGANNRRLIDDDHVAAKLAQLKAEVSALRSLTALSISRGLREAVPGAEGNIVALYFADLTKRLHAVALDLFAPHALSRSGPLGDWTLHYLEAFKWSIGGGTSEIRRNTIGERVLGLPKPKVGR